MGISDNMGHAASPVSTPAPAIMGVAPDPKESLELAAAAPVPSSTAHEAKFSSPSGARGRGPWEFLQDSPASVSSGDSESNCWRPLLGGDAAAFAGASDQDQQATLRRRVVQLEALLAEKEAENRALRDGGADSECGSLEHFIPRLSWLVCLLLFQSVSSFILQHFHHLIHVHPSIVYYLTMLVGAGGNAGGQSVVLMVRGIATGHTISFLQELSVGLRLGIVMALVTLMRIVVIMGQTSTTTTIALCLSMFCIVVSSVLVGTLLPRLLLLLHMDPAHSSAAIQVLMDIGGIGVTCFCTSLVFWLLPPEPAPPSA
eukprot:NODE_10470_length_1349_cov_5.643208.p1 GENE.NODE_10470_length_1349_cov_5.643208~~NODE_10470_length_1349_cov_5.643208.p1  ORF type:complete len:315 (-),score=71.39 NODE_10470_length_1349_cov_5.643208:309-1253(-)